MARAKSTLIKGLERELVAHSIKYLVTREPGGTPLGDEIRQILLRVKGDTPGPRTELLLYQAGRAQHVDYVIRPSLQKSAWVLCDRYSASSVAFQSGGRGLRQSDVEWLNEFSTGGLRPNLTVLLDLTVEESERRRADRDADRFESEAREFHEKVRQTYLRLAKADAFNWLVLDASQPSEVSLETLTGGIEAKKMDHLIEGVQVGHETQWQWLLKDVEGRSAYACMDSRSSSGNPASANERSRGPSALRLRGVCRAAQPPCGVRRLQACSTRASA